MITEDVKIIENKQIAENIYELKVSGDIVSNMTSPGQFVHLRVGQSIDHILRRPISICDVDIDSKQLTMVYRAEGMGTTRLSDLKPSIKINALGPLGNGFPIEACEPGQTALLVGGGVGVPPLYYLSKQLRDKGVKVIHVLGFATDNVIFYEESFKELGPTYIATVDGSNGTKGFVTDVIENEAIAYDVMYTCGPVPMLRALEATYRQKPLYLSLEQRMGCGIGACMACVCHLQDDPTQTGYRKVCSDGPVFPAGEVVL